MLLVRATKSFRDLQKLHVGQNACRRSVATGGLHESRRMSVKAFCVLMVLSCLVIVSVPSTAVALSHEEAVSLQEEAGKLDVNPQKQ